MIVLVAEIPFIAPAARKETPPQAVCAAVFMGTAGIVVRTHGMSRITWLVAGNGPGLAGLHRPAEIVFDTGVDLAEITASGLKRKPGQFAVCAQQIVMIRPVMDDNVVMVGIVVPEVLGPAFLLSGRCVVDLLAQVPVQGGIMAEPGDKLAVVQLALRSQIAAVKQQLVFRLLGFEMQKHSHLRAVLKHNGPLIQPRAVHAVAFVVIKIGKHVAVVAVDVHGKKRENIHSFACEVVDCTDNTLSLAAVPRWIAVVPVRDMGRPAFDQIVLVSIVLKRPVEILVCQEVLRCIGALFEEILPAALEPQVVPADILQPPFGPQVAPGLVGFDNIETPAYAVVRRQGRAAAVDRAVGALPETDRVIPRPGLVRAEMGPPRGARRGAGIGGVTVGGKIPGDGQ